MVKLGLPLPSANTGGAAAAEARLSRPLGGPRLPTAMVPEIQSLVEPKDV